MKNLVTFSLLGLLMAGCEVRIPSYVISQRKMTDLLFDYHQAQQAADALGEGRVEEERYVLIQKVFQKYGVTEAEFDSSMVWYAGNSKYLTEIYNEIDDRLKREMKALGVDEVADEYANLSATGDTALIWSRANLWLRNDVRDNLLSFTIIPDSTFALGDTYLLKFDNRFVTNENLREGYAMLVARYENDSVVAQVTRVAGGFETFLRINSSHLTDNNLLRRLEVSFYQDYEPHQGLSMWMVAKPQLIRFRQRKDTVAVDSTAVESLQPVLKRDSTPAIRLDSSERLTPAELRQSQKGERSIKVVKQRQVILPAQPVRRQR